MITHDIIECTPAQAVARLSWDDSGTGWGFLVVRQDGGRLYGAVGPIAGDQPCLGFPLGDETDPTRALDDLILACGLSIIDCARLEFGGSLIAAGDNPLAQAVLAAALAHGARTACLLREMDVDTVSYPGCEPFNYADLGTFDVALDRFVAASPGPVVFVDALGAPDMVLAMAKRVPQYGHLVFCRPDVTAAVTLNIRQVHHLKSAHYVYWSRPEILAEALHFVTVIRRAQRLTHWARVSLPKRG